MPRISKYDIARKQRYVEKLFLGMSPAKAVVAAGLCEDGARPQSVVAQLVKDPFCVDLIEEHQKELKRRFSFDRDTAVRMLFEAFEIAKLRGDPNGMVNAVKELNEITGLHPQKGIGVQINNQVNATVMDDAASDAARRAGITRRLRGMSEDELLELTDIQDAEYVVM